MERDRVMERKGVMEEEEEEARESSGSSLSSPDGSPEASSRPEYGFPSPSSTSNGDYAFFYQGVCITRTHTHTHTHTHTPYLTATYPCPPSHPHTASDGQHLYLHPVNARCLAMEYGALQHCPDQITATIVETEQLSVTEVGLPPLPPLLFPLHVPLIFPPPPFLPSPPLLFPHHFLSPPFSLPPSPSLPSSLPLTSTISPSLRPLPLSPFLPSSLPPSHSPCPVQEVRDRYRYLSHLPLTCELVLCELELRPPLLSKDTLRAFAG